MPAERRNRQNLNLATGISQAPRSQDERSQLDMFPNRWVRISNKAQDASCVFQNLHSHINVDSLKEAFKDLNGSKALGVDRVNKKEYGKSLEVNLENLVKRIQSGSYRPQPKREVLIPKANGKSRPIAISCFEDKLVDWVVGKILTEVYEPLFIRNSFGYRPGKSADNVIKACYHSLEKNRRPYITEIDFSNFFNTIPHKKLMRILGKRISDRKFKGLIGRFLVGDLINAQGEKLPSEIGTPQGSIMSPVLANIYLHEVLDTWFLENYGSYNNIIVRYADDAIFFFKKEEDMCSFKETLSKRCQNYGLKLNEEKSRSFCFAKSTHESFNFLGFTFYWGKQGSRRILKVKTQKEKLHKTIQEFDGWIKTNRNRTKLGRLWEMAKAKIRGHINYYGYWMNGLKIKHFYHEAVRSLFKWLNRRSQRRSYNWPGFEERIKNFPLMVPLSKMKFKKLGRTVYVHF
jgi:RNA-directed DNA polymerase